MSQYPRGSEWRKWDLHIHSTASDGTATPQQIIEQAKAKGLSVIAITDHHTAKNIDETKRIGLEQGIYVISGIEFRTEYGEKSVHIIGLFPDKFDKIVLDQKALHDLILSKLNLSETYIIAKGKEHDDSITDEKAFKKGMFEVQVDFKQASDLIRKYGGIVTVHAGDKSNSIDAEMKHQGKGVRNVKNIEDSLGPLKTELLNHYVDICEINKADSRNINFYWQQFGRASILASDAHNVNDIGRECVWIKADPNLNGLKQAVIEPDRIFMGDIPPTLDRVRKNKTKTIDKVIVTWSSDYTGNQGEWFRDVEIGFNPEMSVIIGNKGSGKTAIAEVVGLLGNSKNFSDFVFLHEDKFRKKKLAKNFDATLIWSDKVYSTSANLNQVVDNNADELIHFVPQNSFEKFCNNNDESFSNEVNNVVFSQMDNADKLGFTTFRELLSHEKSAIESRKKSIELEIDALNSNIKLFEEKRDSDHKESLVNIYDTAQRELSEHLKNKPQEITPPEELNTEEYRECNRQLEEIDLEIKVQNEKLEQLNRTQSDLSLIRTEFLNLERTINSKVDTLSGQLTEFNIDVSDVFNYQLNLEPLNSIYKKNESELKKLAKLLVSEDELNLETDKDSLTYNRHMIQQRIQKFDNDNKGKLTSYHKYLSDNREWNETNIVLTNKVEKLRKDIEYIGDYKTSDLAKDIRQIREERLSKVKQLYECYTDEQSIYDKFKLPIVQFLEKYSVELINFPTAINSGIYAKEEFANGFVEKYIHNTVNSEFKGADGTKKIREYISSADFTTESGLEEFISLMEADLDKGFESKCIHKAFKIRQYDQFLNDFYKLTFLEARYSLQLFGKELNALSPGERGSLLLVFYLLLDARDTPLILDQPEDNLDNQSVAEILVPFIKTAKKRRQIIIITHNSNLAVVSDAEQVIRVKIDKQGDNKFTFESGSLESDIIQDVVNVLEGTITSFNIRKSKYPN